MDLKDFIVLKDFLSHNSKRCYQPGEIYNGGSSYHTKQLLKCGFIKEPDCTTKEEPRMPKFSPIATSQLAGVEIASEDYSEDGKERFTYDEALKIEECLKDTGWRLPTRSEWVLICEEFGQKDGKLDSNVLIDYLKLKDNTNYWSRTASSSSNAYYLYMGSGGYLYPAYCNYRAYGFGVRLVKNIDNQKEKKNE